MATSFIGRALVAWCSTVLSAGLLCGQQNLLVNGSFEIGPQLGYYGALLLNGSTALTGWVVTGIDIEIVPTPYHFAADGTRLVELNGNNPGGIEQTVATVAGGFYTVQFKLAGSPGSPNRMVRVSAAGQWQDYAFDSSSTTGQFMGWVDRTFVFRAAASTTVLSFVTLNAGEFGPSIDHVRLYYTPYDLFGTACAWSGGVPHLDASLPPRVGQPFGLVLTNLPPNQPGAVLWGYSNSTWSGNQLPLSLAGIGMAGCNLYTSPDVISVIGSTGSFGAFVWGELLPNNPAFVGLHFYNQAFVLAPGANALGVVMTNGGAGIVGS